MKQLRHFDAWFGAHQKIDRIARDHLGLLLNDNSLFPSRKLIITFEGMDGPDGIKRKTPAKDEPWHYYNPDNPDDIQIFTIIDDHHQQLVKALCSKNQPRAAFEAAWLAHAIVDGLTPAHHYPYEEELIKLRGGVGIETRTTPKEKILMPGDNLGKQIHNNWKMWGDKGLLATHFAFEWGVAAMILPLRLNKAHPAAEDMSFVCQEGIVALFKKRAREIADLNMYEQFYQSAWTPKLAKVVRKELAPMITNTVTLAWYAAAREAERKG